MCKTAGHQFHFFRPSIHYQLNRNNGRNCKQIRVSAMNIDFQQIHTFNAGGDIRYQYNPQIEMFARFKMKSSFHKTKRII